MIQLLHGDCLERMKELPDCSIDACVTDPPYGLSFMAKAWDYEVPSVEIWQECFRVLKPGGHLLAFAGTRTQHRMAVNIEDAGFEIRDMIAWVYGSGFPKSHNLKDEWEGWGTASKPALEPITVARKPFKGTVAANVLEHGTGALNIDGCRVPAPDNQGKVWIRGGAGVNARSGFKAAQAEPQLNGTTESVAPHEAGRWPANLIHDGSDEVVGLFPDVKGQVGMKKDQGGFRFIAGDTHSAQSFTRGRTDSGSAARFLLRQSQQERPRRRQYSPDRQADRSDALPLPSRHPTGWHCA